MGAALCLAPAVARLGAQTPAPSARDVARAADSAYRARDWGAFRRHALLLRQLRPYDADAILLAARAAARAGRPAEAIGALAEYARLGLLVDLDSVADLAPLRARADLAPVRRRLARNAARVPAGDTAFVLAEPELLAEDIAYDARRGAFLVGSLRKRKVVRVDSTGRGADLLAPTPDVWAVPALAVDGARGVLWAGTASSPVQLGGDSASAGRSALLALSLDDGRVLRRIEAPADRAPHFFGDLAVDAEGAVYVSDAESSTVYRVRPGRDSLEVFLPALTVWGPQTPAVSGDALLVPDYVRGVWAADRATGRGRWLAKPDTLTLAGIDGLYACGTGLVAVQNGTRPMRVLWLELDPRAPRGAPRVRSWRVLAANDPVLDEPTHGALVGDAFYLLANNQAYRYRGAAPRPADPQVVMRLRVPC